MVYWNGRWIHGEVMNGQMKADLELTSFIRSQWRDFIVVEGFGVFLGGLLKVTKPDGSAFGATYEREKMNIVE